MTLTASSVRRTGDMDADKVSFRGKGCSGTAAKSATTNIELLLTEERLLQGVFKLILHNHERGDYMHFEVVDVDNIIGYGANTVLERYVDSWYADAAVDNQGEFSLDFVAFINAGLYLRVVYVSTGAVNDVDVKINYILHKPKQ